MPILCTEHLPTLIFNYPFILQKLIDEYYHKSLPSLVNKLKCGKKH